MNLEEQKKAEEYVRRLIDEHDNEGVRSLMFNYLKALGYSTLDGDKKVRKAPTPPSKHMCWDEQPSQNTDTMQMRTITLNANLQGETATEVLLKQREAEAKQRKVEEMRVAIQRLLEEAKQRKQNDLQQSLSDSWSRPKLDIRHVLSGGSLNWFTKNYLQEPVFQSTPISKEQLEKLLQGPTPKRAVVEVPNGTVTISGGTKIDWSSGVFGGLFSTNTSKTFSGIGRSSITPWKQAGECGGGVGSAINGGAVKMVLGDVKMTIYDDLALAAIGGGGGEVEECSTTSMSQQKKTSYD